MALALDGFNLDGFLPAKLSSYTVYQMKSTVRTKLQNA